MPMRRLVDRELGAYLVPGERVVTEVRRHWISQLKPALALVGATVLAVVLDTNTPATRGGQLVSNFGWTVWFVALTWFLWRIANWQRDFFVATDRRLLMFYGFIRRKVAMMPLTKVTDMTYDRTIIGRVFGYGSFVLESAGQDQALSRIDFVPNSGLHYRNICAVLFGRKPTAGDDRDDDGGPGPGGRPPRPGDGWDGRGDDGGRRGPGGDGWGRGWGRGGGGVGGRVGGRADGDDDLVDADDVDDDGWEQAHPVRHWPESRTDRTDRPRDTGRPGLPGRTLYRSADLAARDDEGGKYDYDDYYDEYDEGDQDDTGEIPVVRPRRLSSREQQDLLYPPTDWT